jgi:hypothetical protein
MRRTLLLPIAATLLLAACGGKETTACGDPGGSNMCPGADCLSCHSFKAAGTVFAGAGSTTPVSGATVTLVPATGSTVTLTTNSAGNFYGSGALAFPVQITIHKGADTVHMTDAGSGGCNGCHDSGFRIHLP